MDVESRVGKRHGLVDRERVLVFIAALFASKRFDIPARWSRARFSSASRPDRRGREARRHPRSRRDHGVVNRGLSTG